ncbi:ribonuclease HII [Candidatus Parcubacteria bacterium]|nr:ribonuclease HII [Candidatus Parcubacteria bacterium]
MSRSSPEKHIFVVGIDEAGRGPLAGPVAVGACRIRRGEERRFAGFRDSKKLSEKNREAWLLRMREWKKEGVIDYAVCFASARVIDREGIVPAVRSALARALGKLVPDSGNTQVLLDGGLKAPSEFKNQKTIIKGDEKEPSIALASIAAKVSRDRLMKRLAKKYPKYAFEVHKGYGTLVHRTAIRAFGLSPEHRISFCRNV